MLYVMSTCQQGDISDAAMDGVSERRESDLREEISHLRDARDSLMMRRQKLDRRIHRVSFVNSCSQGPVSSEIYWL